MTDALTESKLSGQLAIARNAIATAAANRDPEALKRIHDQAGALEKLVAEAAKKNKNLGANLKKLNELTRVRILSAREMGVVLRDLVHRGGPRYRGRTLQDLGVSRNQSAKWQKLADFPDVVDTYIDASNRRSEEASIAGYLRFATNTPPFASATNDRRTPLHIIEAALTTLGHITLDPCSNLGTPNVPATQHYTTENDGLTQQWSESVFMHPPSGRTLKAWVRKLRTEIAQGHTTAAIALLPARPSSDWFEELACFDLCFLRGRLKFDEGHTAPFPSMCAYTGPNPSKFADAFKHLGPLYRPTNLPKS